MLAAPDDDISLGSGNLSIYKDIATVDTGPGYLNGILSLWLNSESPQREFNEEEKRGRPYFHRAKAAELLAVLDKTFPSSLTRPDLHAELIRAYAGYGQDDAVIRAGNEFLKDFPDSSRRIAVAMLMADAYARTNNTAAEFALYDRMLAELAAKSKGMPLSESSAAAGPRLDDSSIERYGPAGRSCCLEWRRYDRSCGCSRPRANRGERAHAERIETSASPRCWRTHLRPVARSLPGTPDHRAKSCPRRSRCSAAN